MRGMRKWVVAGLLALVASGVSWYLLSQPRKGTLEYHKRKYVEAHLETARRDPIGDWIRLHAPMAVDDLYWRPKLKRLDFHRNALLEAGYLVEREFVVSNRPARSICDDLYKVRNDVFNDTNDLAGIPFFYWNGTTNRISVLARAIDVDYWEDVIRKADVRETK